MRSDLKAGLILMDHYSTALSVQFSLLSESSLLFSYKLHNVQIRSNYPSLCPLCKCCCYQHQCLTVHPGLSFQLYSESLTHEWMRSRVRLNAQSLNNMIYLFHTGMSLAFANHPSSPIPSPLAFGPTVPVKWTMASLSRNRCAVVIQPVLLNVWKELQLTATVILRMSSSPA